MNLLLAIYGMDLQFWRAKFLSTVSVATLVQLRLLEVWLRIFFENRFTFQRDLKYLTRPHIFFYCFFFSFKK